jgi:hypothetical protein
MLAPDFPPVPVDVPHSAQDGRQEAKWNLFFAGGSLRRIFDVVQQMMRPRIYIMCVSKLIKQHDCDRTSENFMVEA